ncbi:MAG: hypothetical protein II811_09180 [Spirochaetaceae bacterium]|nr:hypothetical protein [Spirochaetaceae bacterium]
MENRNIQKKDFLSAVLGFALVYAFLVYLNAIFPTQSDDLGKKIEGIQRAIRSYMTWNGRIGELMLVTFGSYFATLPLYSVVNAFVGAAVITLLFVNIFARLPENDMKDMACFSVLFAFIMFDPIFAFGSVFYWAAGSFNYLWAWFFILLCITPVRLYWHNQNFLKSASFAILVLGIPVGVAAGWSSEFGIVLILAWGASIVYAKTKGIKLPLWYYTTFAAFVIGWLILYVCPGARLRARYFKNYCSLIDLLKLGPVKLTEKIFKTYDIFNKNLYYELFFLVSLFLLLSAVLYKPSLKKFEKSMLAIFVMLYCMQSLSKLCFLVSAIFVCIPASVVAKKENMFLSKLFAAMSIVLILELLFIGATIQVGVPRRSNFQYTILTACMVLINLAFCFETLKNNAASKRILAVCCMSLSILFALFVGIACMKMHKKWEKMELSIQEQKAKGSKDIVVDRLTFVSSYWNYGDWGNPGNNAKVWPNTQYAGYYGADTFIAQ